MNLAEQLKALRAGSGLSYREAARGIGIAVSTLHKAENGAMPKLDTAAAMADFYSVPIESLAKLARQ